MSEEMRDMLIAGASQLVTLAGPARARIGREMREIGIIPGGSVLISEGRIASAGPAAAVLEQSSPDAETIDARGCVVMPGFIDAHTHPVFAGTREDEYEMRTAGADYAGIAAAGGGIMSTVNKTRAATEAELFDLALERVGWFLRHGTTTIEAKSGYGLSVKDELKILRVIGRLNRETPLDLAPTFLGAHEVPAEYRGSPDGRARYARLVIDEMLPAVAREGLARYADAFVERGVFTVDEARAILTAAKKLGLGVRLHAEQLGPSGAAMLAAELGAASADHLDYVDEAGILALGRAGVTAVLLPGAVFNLGLSHYPPARKLIDGGVAVALATDFNPGSSPTPSMQLIHSIACSQMGMSPAECITASTVNAAYSLGIGEQAGSLEPGKQADVVVFGVDDYRQIPYFAGVNHAKTVIKSGRVVRIPGRS